MIMQVVMNVCSDQMIRIRNVCQVGKGRVECGRERSAECRATTKDCNVVQTTEGMKDSARGLKRRAKRMDEVQVDRRERR